MSSVWVDAVCKGCGKNLEDKSKAIIVLPATMRATKSYASGYGEKGQLRVMPSKGRKGQQQPETYHEKCWPGVRSGSGK